MALQGVVLKPRFTRGTHTFDFPLLLSHDPRSWRVLLGAYVLPPLAVYVTKRHIIRPLRRWRKTRQVTFPRRPLLRLRCLPHLCALHCMVDIMQCLSKGLSGRLSGLLLTALLAPSQASSVLQKSSRNHDSQQNLSVYAAYLGHTCLKFSAQAVQLLWRQHQGCLQLIGACVLRFCVPSGHSGWRGRWSSWRTRERGGRRPPAHAA